MDDSPSANEGDTVWSRVPEDSACHMATESMHGNYWSHWALEPGLCNKKRQHNEKPVSTATVVLLTTTRKRPCSNSAQPKRNKEIKRKSPQISHVQMGYALIMAYNGITTRNLPETSYLGSRVRQKISTLSYASPSMCPGTANSKCNVNAHIPFSCEYEEEKKGQIVPILLKPFFFLH